jgi:sterol desaturase/sphingolipid hydroxylase (fatty acid hydroxylase superfamily)
MESLSTPVTVGIILAAMAVIAFIETVIPLHASGRRNRAHLAPNLALTLITFVTNALFNVALAAALMYFQANGIGLLQMFTLQPLTTVAIVVVALDFSTYLTHVALHRIPLFWRFHSVHHSDPALDVTTTIRQHPGEGVIRYAFLVASTIALGASPAAFAIYRALSALNALPEHANIRAPLWLDRILSLVTTWPHMHKVHHSRITTETDSNYGNLLSLFDRVFGTFTPSDRGVSIRYGLDGYDDPAVQTTAGLLAVPFRRDRPMHPWEGESPDEPRHQRGARRVAVGNCRKIQRTQEVPGQPLRVPDADHRHGSAEASPSHA